MLALHVNPCSLSSANNSQATYYKEIMLIFRLLGLNLSEPMHLRKRTTIVLIVSAMILFVVGSIASLIAIAGTTPEKTGYSDSGSLEPLSGMSKIVQATRRDSLLAVKLNATERIIIIVALNGEAEFTKNESQLDSSFVLREPGSWNVTFRNDNEERVTFTYGIDLTTFYPMTTYPANGLLIPTFATAEVLLCTLLPVNFYDSLKGMSKKTKETVLLCIIAFLALGFMPLLSLLTGTNTPLISPTSSSMEPTVSSGDLAIVTSVYPRSLQVGDIIVFDKLMETLQSKPSQIEAPTMHRIDRIFTVNNQRFFITKGDNNPDEDTWVVPEEGVVGKVIFVVPLIGNVFLLLSRLDVKIEVIAATVAIIALWPSNKTWAKIRGKNHEKENLPNS